MPDKEDQRLGARELFATFKSTATIHGLPHTAGEDFYRWRRCLWLCLIWGMTAILLGILYIEFNAYLSFSTNTVVTAKLNTSLRFPTVTVCNLNQFHKSRIPENDTRLMLLLRSLSEFGYMTAFPEINVTSGKEWTGEELSDFASDAAHRLDQMFRKCFWNGKEVPCEEVLERTPTDSGYCFSFNKRGNSSFKTTLTGPSKGLRVIMDIEQSQYFYSRTAQAGVQVLIHDPMSPPLMSDHGIYVQPGTSTYLGVSLEDRTALGPPYKAFGSTECTDTDAPDFVNPVKRYPGSKFSVSACRRECLIKYLLFVCRCRIFFEPGSERVCSLKETLTCLLPALEEADLVDRACNCQDPCVQISCIPVISVSDFASSFIIKHMRLHNITRTDTYVRENLIDLRVYYNSLTVMKIAQIPAKTINDILGNVGGLMGLFLGASLLSLTELIEILILLLTRVCPGGPCTTASHKQMKDKQKQEDRSEDQRL